MTMEQERKYFQLQGLKNHLAAVSNTCVIIPELQRELDNLREKYEPIIEEKKKQLFEPQKVYIRDYLIARNGAVYICDVPLPKFCKCPDRKYLHKDGSWNNLLQKEGENIPDCTKKPGYFGSKEEAIEFAKSLGYIPIDETEFIA